MTVLSNDNEPSKDVMLVTLLYEPVNPASMHFICNWIEIIKVVVYLVMANLSLSELKAVNLKLG